MDFEKCCYRNFLSGGQVKKIPLHFRQVQHVEAPAKDDIHDLNQKILNFKKNHLNREKNSFLNYRVVDMVLFSDLSDQTESYADLTAVRGAVGKYLQGLQTKTKRVKK